MSYPLELNVPIPPPRMPTKPCAYPFADMVVGASFVIPAKNPEQARKKVINAAKSWRNGRQADFAIETRIIDGGVRVWRVEYRERPKRRKQAPTIPTLGRLMRRAA